MIKFKIKNEPGTVEVPSAQALVEHMNMTAKWPAPDAQAYMLEYSKRAVIDRDIDIRASDYDSFVEDLHLHGDITILP